MGFADTLASMKESIRTSLDELASPRSSPTSKTNALKNLERHLATACSNATKDSTIRDAFLGLQYTFECNIPSNLLPWIKLSTFRLEGLTSKSLSEDERCWEMDELSSQLNLSLSLLQGIALNHESSKEFLGRKCSLEILLDLLLASRYLPTQPDSAGEAASKPSTPHVTSVVLDSLLCILVDSTPALRTFETANGVQAVVKILKRAGTPREVRMKCLEFLYFYLLDETPSMDPLSALSPSIIPLQPTPPPTAPATPIRPAKPYISANTPLRPTSYYGSSTYYFSSSSTFGTLSFSDSIKSSSSSSGSSSSSSSGGKSLRSASGSSTHSFSSTFSNASSSTAVSSAQNSPSFTQESNAPPPVFMPSGKRSPVKTQRITTPQNLGKKVISPPNSPPLQDESSKIKLAQPRSLAMLRKEVDYIPQSPKKVLAVGMGKPSMTETNPVATPTPVGKEPIIRRVHRKSLSTSTLASGAVSPALFRKRSDGEKAKGTIGTPLRTSRTKLVSDVVEEKDEKAECHVKDETGWKTTEEKKEFLGTMLGNVDALVEGVRKAGVWGLG